MLREFHDYLVETEFPDLPPNKNRLQLLGKLEGVTVGEAMWILNMLYQSLDVDGDVFEFGCAAGATSVLLANEIRATGKCLWLFDSFVGLPKPTDKDELIDDVLGLGTIEAYEGTMCFSLSSVTSKLADISFPTSRVQIVPGFIEEAIKSLQPSDKVSFAFVDFDFYEPTRTALDFLAKHMPSGGRIVVDDYGFFSSGAKAAVDEFVAVHSDSFAIVLPPPWAGHFAVLVRYSSYLQ